MFVIYDSTTKKSLSYTSAHTEQSEGKAIAETSIVDDLQTFDCYIKEVKYDEIKGYDIVTAIESHRR